MKCRMTGSKCPRCDGFLVQDHFYDELSYYTQAWTSGSRCVNCGYITKLEPPRHKTPPRRPLIAPRRAGKTRSGIPTGYRSINEQLRDAQDLQQTIQEARQ